MFWILNSFSFTENNNHIKRIEREKESRLIVYNSKNFWGFPSHPKYVEKLTFTTASESSENSAKRGISLVSLDHFLPVLGKNEQFVLNNFSNLTLKMQLFCPNFKMKN